MNQTCMLVFATENYDKIVISTTTQQQITYKDGKKFIEDIPKLFKNVKGVILCSDGYTLKSEDETNMDFCEVVKEKLDSLQIQSCFYSNDDIIALLALVAGNIKINFNDTALFVMFGDLAHISVTEYRFTENGYKQIDERNVAVDLKENPKDVREKIFASSNPKKIILASHGSANQMLKFLRQTLKSKKLIVFDQLLLANVKNKITELSKWFFDKSFVKYHIIQGNGRSYYLAADFGDGELSAYIRTSKFEDLPITESRKLPKSYRKYAYGCQYSYKDEITVDSTLHLLEKNCHEHKFTLTVDLERNIKVEHEEIILPEIEALPQTLNEKFDKNIPVIGLYSGCSFLCVKEDNGYEFLDAWNGLYGRELAISFDEEKPKFFESAMDMIAQKRTFVVLNIVESMSMTYKKLEACKYLKFIVEKDSANPVLFEFDNFDGTKKAASPAFLMAMLLRQHFKIIKEETGEKPTKIGFVLFTQLKNDERKRVEEQLKESCKLLKTECVFVKA